MRPDEAAANDRSTTRAGSGGCAAAADDAGCIWAVSESDGVREEGSPKRAARQAVRAAASWLALSPLLLPCLEAGTVSVREGKGERM